MKKKVFGRKLGRSRPAREALFASLSRSMILNGKIVTTYAKAKAIQGDLEKFITLSKKGDLSARRKALAKLDNTREATNVLFQKIGPAFSTRKSGFTRIITLPVRKGDNAKMVRIEWTEKIDLSEKPKEKVKKEVKKVKTSKVSKTVKKEVKPKTNKKK